MRAVTSRTAHAALVISIAVGLAAPAWATPGQRDDSFGTAGKVITPGIEGRASDVVIDDQGRLIVAGHQGDEGFAFGPLDMVVARYLTNGELDASFDQDGIALIGGLGLSMARAAALQPDGKIVVVGSSKLDGNGGFGIARLTTDGLPDPTFSDDGVARLDFGPEIDTAYAVAITDAGSIIAAGTAEAVPGQVDFAVAVFGPDGDSDASFSDDGVATYNIAAGDVAHDVAILGSGKIMIGGETQKMGKGFAAIRLLAGGALDTSFGGGDGKVAVGAPSGSGEAMAIQADGKILLAGGVPPETASDGGWNMAVVRLRRSGELDPTFSSDGRVTSDIGGGADVAKDVLALPSGKILIAGYTENRSSGRLAFGVVRYRPDGRLDRGFGVEGKVKTSLQKNDQAFAAVRQPDGKVVVAGETVGPIGRTFGLVRYLG